MSRIFAVLHNGELVYPDPTTDICSGDIVFYTLIPAQSNRLRKSFPNKIYSGEGGDLSPNVI